MSWLVLVIIAVVFDSIRIFIDNYISDVYYKGRGSAAQKLFYGYFFTITSIIMMFVFGIETDKVPVATMIWFLISGTLSSLAGIPYYRALEIEDSTNLTIFVQMAPVLYLILGWFFLDESFSPLQLAAFVVILAAPILIILTSRKNGRCAKFKAAVMAFLYVFIAVIGNLIFVKNNSSDFHFTTGMAFLFLGKGISNLAIVYCNRKWVKRFRAVMKSSKKKVLRPLIIDGVLCLIKDSAYRAALLLAPAVALASAVSDSSTPIVTFLLGIVLTLIWPKFGREKLNKKSVLIHLVATLLVVAGIILLQLA